MSAAAAQLIASFESLPTAEKQIVAQEILLRLPPFDSGALKDEEVAIAGDGLAAMLDQEERASQAR